MDWVPSIGWQRQTLLSQLRRFHERIASRRRGHNVREPFVVDDYRFAVPQIDGRQISQDVGYFDSALPQVTLNIGDLAQNHRPARTGRRRYVSRQPMPRLPGK